MVVCGQAGLYAGTLAAMAAIQNLILGIAIQGFAVGYMLSTVVMAMVSAYLTQSHGCAKLEVQVTAPKIDMANLEAQIEARRNPTARAAAARLYYTRGKPGSLFPTADSTKVHYEVKGASQPWPRARSQAKLAAQLAATLAAELAKRNFNGTNGSNATNVSTTVSNISVHMVNGSAGYTLSVCDIGGIVGYVQTAFAVIFALITIASFRRKPTLSVIITTAVIGSCVHNPRVVAALSVFSTGCAQTRALSL